MDPAGGVCRDCREAQLSSTCCRVGLLRRGARIRRRADDADHISALPDDLLLQILARVGCARAAAHMGLVSRRWRGLWTRLPELDFHRISPDWLRAALNRVARPAGSLRISIPGHHCLSPAAVSSLLRAVALVAPAKLAVDVHPRSCGDAVELPCFDRTTSLKLSFASRFTVPPVGDFTVPRPLVTCSPAALTCASSSYGWELDSLTVHSPLLEELDVRAVMQLRHVDIAAPVLKNVMFESSHGVDNEHIFSVSGDFTALESLYLGYCHTDLGDLLPRCPRLCKLRMSSWKLDSLTIHSPSLEELDVFAVVQLRHVDIVAPVLKKLRFISNEHSFSFSGDFTALESLCLDSCHTDLGNLLPRCPRLCKLRISNWSLDSLTVHSPSLEELDICADVQLQCVNIVVPALKKLRFTAINGINKESSFLFSAPQLKDVSWHCESRSGTERFGAIWRMYYLTLKTLEPLGTRSSLTASKIHVR